MPDEPVLFRIRSILMAYRYLWRSTKNKFKETDPENNAQDETIRYEWEELAGDIIGFIEIHTGKVLDFDFPANSLQNFVRGLTKFDKEKNKRVQKFSTPRDPRRIEAMVVFLTNPKSKGYACERDILLAPVKPIVPLQLVEFLNEEKHSPRTIQMPQVQGRYFCQAQESRDVEDLLLQILDTWDNRMAMVELTKYFKSTIAKQSLTGNLTSGTGKSTHALYSGWLVLTSEDTLLICVQNIRDNNNLFYLSMGIDNIAEQTRGAQTIVFLEHDYPEVYTELLSANDEGKIIDRIIQSWKENLCVFRKETAE